MSLNTLIIMPSLLKERSAIHTNVDDKLIFPEIKFAQDAYILPLLGTALFNKIQSLIATYPTSALMPASPYKTLLDLYVIDALINYTMAELPSGLNYQFWNTGVVSTQKEQAQLPSMSDMFNIVDRYKKKAEHYDNRCRLFLVQNQGLYPEYRDQNGGIDSVYPDNTSFTSPIYLGGDEFIKPNASYNEQWPLYYE
jgi:hypothetical protein